MEELEKHNRLDLVENVVLIGAPVSSAHGCWKWSRCVAGRLVNVFCEQDWLLYFVFRTTYLKLGVAGLEPVVVPRVENHIGKGLIPRGEPCPIAEARTEQRFESVLP
mmetsp:Transcript_23348/g.33496  ORF Transcript_23348/g.33496 Transcript_23348/m.33496 type:complete len:107 (-) Transcript_23348:274-594(-)